MIIYPKSNKAGLKISKAGAFLDHHETSPTTAGRAQDAGRKSMGYRMVMAGTPSLGPKLNFFTRATILASSAAASMSLDSILQLDTLPSGSILKRNTTLPCNVGFLRSSRL